MLLRTILLVFILLACLRLTCCAKKKGGNKKKISSKKKSNPGKIVVKVVEDDRLSPPKATYKPEPDRDYWEPGGTQASYRLEDSPQFDPYFLDMYDELRAAVGLERDNKMLTGRLDLTFSQQTAQLAVYEQMIYNLHIIDTFYRPSYSTGQNHIVFAAHLDTRGGQELAGIFADSPSCTPEICMDPLKYHSFNMVFPAYSQAHYFIPPGQTRAKAWTGHTLDKLEILLEIFSEEEVKGMICNGESDWFRDKSEDLKFWLEEFLENPTWAGPPLSDTILAETHDYIGTAMIHDLLNEICEK